MPFRLPFNYPFFYNNRFYHYANTNKPANQIQNNNNKFEPPKKDSENKQSSESFFEVFGLKLYFDDILIICLLFFLYIEKVQDEELFICLILLLFS